jgi:hypothetical protein
MYPLHSSRHIKGEAQPRGIPFIAKASSGEPAVALGFGVVFAMDAQDGEEADGLLGQSGFQLDLTGIHQLRGPSQLRPGHAAAIPWPQVYIQARLGLNSDQSLNVVATDSTATPANQANDDTGTQFEDAVQQADQIALTVQPEVVFPIGPGNAEISIVPEYGVTWTRLQPFVFPRIEVNGEPQSPENLFDEDLRLRALRVVNQTIPLTNYGTSIVFRFIADDRPLFYIGAGYLQKQVIHRGVTFRRASQGGAPDPNSLRGLSEGVSHGFWRGVFGARIPGVVDVRLDAVTPISREAVGPPILRLVIGKDFPLVR